MLPKLVWRHVPQLLFSPLETSLPQSACLTVVEINLEIRRHQDASITVLQDTLLIILHGTAYKNVRLDYSLRLSIWLAQETVQPDTMRIMRRSIAKVYAIQSYIFLGIILPGNACQRVQLYQIIMPILILKNARRLVLVDFLLINLREIAYRLSTVLILLLEILSWLNA